MELTQDAKYSILLHLDFKQIMNLGTTNKSYNHISNDINFWVYKINYDFDTNFSKNKIINFDGSKWLEDYYDDDITNITKSSYHKIKFIYKALRKIQDIVNEMMEIVIHEAYYADKTIMPFLPAEVKSAIVSEEHLQFTYDGKFFLIHYSIDDDPYNMLTYTIEENELYRLFFRYVLNNPELVVNLM